MHRLLRVGAVDDGQLLIDYDPSLDRPCSVYAWVWRNVRYAALDQLRTLNATRQAGHHFEVSLTEFEPDEETVDDDELRRTPEALQVSETPLRASYLRVTTLTPWLVTLAHEMVGKKLTLKLKNGTSQLINFDRSHQNIWLHWLALKESNANVANFSDSDLNDLSEEALSKELGISKTKIQRHSDEAFAYMLQHAAFPKYLDLMIPNRVRGVNASDENLRAAMLASLDSAKGKVAFRALVHVWLMTHYQAQ